MTIHVQGNQLSEQGFCIPRVNFEIVHGLKKRKAQIQGSIKIYSYKYVLENALQLP